LIAIGYTRVSTGRQESSPENQDRDIRRYCDQQGWTVLDVRYEQNISAKYGEERRLVLAGIHDEMRKKVRQWDVIVVWKYDRIFRDEVEEELQWREYEKFEVDVFATAEPHPDRKSATGRAMHRIFAVFRQHEREQVGERTYFNNTGRVYKGVWPAGQPPMGYTWDPETKTLSVDPKRAEDARTVFRIYLETSGSLSDTARRLNASGIAGNRNAKFTPTQVKRHLQNPLYRGVIYFGHARGTIDIERIIPDGWTQEADRLIELNTNTRRRSKAHTYTAILWCGRCGHKYGLRTKSKSSECWMCSEKRKFDACDNGTITTRRLNRMVIKNLKKVLLAEIRAIEKEYMSLDKPQRRNAEQRTKSLLAKRQRLIDLAADGTITKSELQTRLLAIDAELSQTKPEKPHSPNEPEQLRRFIDCLETEWEHLTGTERRSLLMSSLNKIEILDGRKPATIKLHTVFGTEVVCQE
jgi:site-specific DNA recombinase